MHNYAEFIQKSDNIVWSDERGVLATPCARASALVQSPRDRLDRPRNGPKLGHASTMLYEPEFKALLIMHLTVIYGYNLFEKQNAETRA